MLPQAVVAHATSGMAAVASLTLSQAAVSLPTEASYAALKKAALTSEWPPHSSSSTCPAVHSALRVAAEDTRPPCGPPPT